MKEISCVYRRTRTKRRIQREKEQEALRKERELKRQQLLKEAEARNSQKEKLWPKKRQIRC